VYRLQHADHVKELAEALERAIPSGAAAVPIQVTQTSLGIRISGGRMGSINHYAFSAVSGRMTDEAATALADLILKLTRSPSRHDLIRGREGVFHVVAECSN
jgi:hypothetical protein